MKITRLFSTAASLLLFATCSYAWQRSAARAQRTTAPDALVAQLYKAHDAGRGPFFQTKDRARVDRFFEKGLAGLIWKEAIDSEGEVGALGADPLYDAQDTEINNFKVGRPGYDGDKATVKVSFVNFGERKELTYLLVKEGGAWKIADIRYGELYALADALGGRAGQGGEGEPAFEGTYTVGDTTCDVRPVRMAFEVRCGGAKEPTIFFYEAVSPEDKPAFSTSGKGAGRRRFAFDSDRYESGKYTGADGKEVEFRKKS